jgi:hypothetical protein
LDIIIAQLVDKICGLYLIRERMEKIAYNAVRVGTGKKLKLKGASNDTL